MYAQFEEYNVKNYMKFKGNYYKNENTSYKIFEYIVYIDKIIEGLSKYTSELHKFDIEIECKNLNKYIDEVKNLSSELFDNMKTLLSENLSNIINATHSNSKVSNIYESRLITNNPLSIEFNTLGGETHYGGYKKKTLKSHIN